MTIEEAKSCICTIKILQKLAYNIHGVMDVVDADNCKKIIKALEQEPCEDAISRQDTLKTIIKHLGIRSEEYLLPAEEAIYKVVKNMPSVIPQPKWISVSERLPEEYADVICCTNKEEVFIATYLGKMNDGADCFDDDNGMMWEGDVVAWMPLPKPYKTESEEK